MSSQLAQRFPLFSELAEAFSAEDSLEDAYADYDVSVSRSVEVESPPSPSAFSAAEEDFFSAGEKMAALVSLAVETFDDLG